MRAAEHYQLCRNKLFLGRLHFRRWWPIKTYRIGRRRAMSSEEAVRPWKNLLRTQRPSPIKPLWVAWYSFVIAYKVQRWPDWLLRDWGGAEEEQSGNQLQGPKKMFWVGSPLGTSWILRNWSEGGGFRAENQLYLDEEARQHISTQFATGCWFEFALEMGWGSILGAKEIIPPA